MASSRVKKQKEPPIDGMSPKALRQLTSAIKQVWSWSVPRRIAKARATGKDGFLRCEKCGKKHYSMHVDHIIPCGAVTSPGFFKRLYIPSSGLQVLCKPCHKPKTKKEARERAKRAYVIRDFK